MVVQAIRRSACAREGRLMVPSKPGLGLKFSRDLDRYVLG